MKNNKYVVYIYNVCNVLMHEKMKPFILLLTLACIVSCGSNRRANAFLSHMDTLYQQNPADIGYPYISRILLKPLML